MLRAVEIDHYRGSCEPVQVLGKTTIADIDEAEVDIEQREDMLDPRPRLALDAVFFAHLGIDFELRPLMRPTALGV